VTPPRTRIKAASTAARAEVAAARTTLNRRALIAAFALMAAPHGAAAQPTGLRIGLLSPSPPVAAAAALVDELRSLGYVEGRNLTIDYRWTSWEGLAEQAVSLSVAVDVIVVVSTPAAIAAKKATSTIPVIMAASADPIGGGVVASLARPGGNVTGLALMNPELTAKRVQFLQQLVPRLNWLGAVYRGPGHSPSWSSG
jgi:putative ABC transport system substrate-binding protein